MLFTKTERQLAESIAALAFANPFLEERITREREILGDSYVASQPYWSLLPDLERKSNIDQIAILCEAFLQSIHARIRGGVRASGDELQLHDEIAIYVLYERYRDSILELIQRAAPGERVAFYAEFRRDVEELLGGGLLTHRASLP